MNKKENRMAVRQTVEKAVIRDEQNRRIQSAATNPVKEVLKIFHTTLRGLEADTVSVNRSKYGTNKVTHEKKKSLAKRVAGAFINPFTAILFCLAFVSTITDMIFPYFSLFGSVPEDFDFLTVVIILTMVFISGTLRFVQESRSGNAAENQGNDRSAAASFSDVSENSWYYEAVSEAAAKGWITGYTGGLFKPESNATRAESVTMINRLLGRSADKMTINMATDIRIMPDVTDSHWAYYQLLEALTEHTCTVSAQEERWTSHQPGTVDLAQGWHNIGGELFHVSSSGCFDYNKEVEGLSLDSCGRYTTGDAELDALLTAAVKEALRPGMTQEERLRAVYDYAKETFSYRGAENVETGSTGWELGVAKTMLTDRKGNCYSWAAAFTYLSRKVGYPSNAIAGESISEKGNRSIHAWTEIEFDGTPYTFDPQIEAVYAANYGINYDLYKKAYGTTPITYVKPEIQEPEEPETPEPDSKLSDILDIVYDGVESPNTAKIALNSENEKYYLGVEGLDYRAGIGSDALVIAIPHSVVLIEMNEGADIEAAKKSIKENADGRKWICVGVSDEDIRVESAGNYILLVMADNSEEYIANFSAHAEEIAAM